MSDKIDELLSDINEIARNVDFYEYGLPMGDEQLRAAVVKYTNQVLAVRDEQIERLAKAFDELTYYGDIRHVQDTGLAEIYKDRCKLNEHRSDARLCGIRAMIKFVLESDE